MAVIVSEEFSFSPSLEQLQHLSPVTSSLQSVVQGQDKVILRIILLVLHILASHIHILNIIYHPLMAVSVCGLACQSLVQTEMSQPYSQLSKALKLPQTFMRPR